jgi:ribosomal protein L29
MSTFAQPLGVDGTASAKRIRREIARVVTAVAG